MSTTSSSPKPSLSHIERTAEQSRDDTLHKVKITKITHATPTIRLFQLNPVFPNHHIKFNPGQWLDVYCPRIPKPGGFTITSSPTSPYLELAIQLSPPNPPAAYLWSPIPQLLNSELQVRVGGDFYWPPPIMRNGGGEVKRVVMVAGGVGINPLMAILRFLAEVRRERGCLGCKVVFLYSCREKGRGEGVLFLDDLRRIFEDFGGDGELRVFFTGSGEGSNGEGENEEDGLRVKRRRMQKEDLVDALGDIEERGKTVAYVCGVKGMTDTFVDTIKNVEGIREENVLCERWW